MDNAAVYIDGFNLYHGMLDAGLKCWLWVDLGKLARLLVPKSMHVSELNYYTAYVKTPGSRERQGAFLEANRELNPKLNVVPGFMQYEDCCTCHKCVKTFQRWQEKRTDVNMAVDIVRGAMSPQPRFKLALLVTGDADQVAAVKAVHDQGLEALIRFPPNRPSSHLTDAAGGSKYAYHISTTQLRKAQLPNEVTRTTTGFTLRRPPEWGERPGFET